LIVVENSDEDEQINPMKSSPALQENGNDVPKELG
jgi:hypothetical protein